MELAYSNANCWPGDKAECKYINKNPVKRLPFSKMLFDHAVKILGPRDLQAIGCYSAFRLFTGLAIAALMD